jgi:Xaa-Pro aminopeptidase
VRRARRGSDWPDPADFAPPPSAADRARWAEADRAARPARLARLRERLTAEGLDAYVGLRSAHARYLTGFTLGDGEEKVAGRSGWFIVGPDDIRLLTDSRYTLQARREAPDATVVEVGYDLFGRWPGLLAEIGAHRVGLEAGFVSQADWERLAVADPAVELVPVDGWLEADRARKTPEEIERIAAAAAIADRALADLLPRIRPGRTERELALELEWAIRTGGADHLAFEIACLAGPEAALPHGTPGDRPILDRAVLLFDFGARVAGYRSDMTRTLFVGEPAERDLAIHGLVAAAQAAAIAAIEATLADPAGLDASGARVLPDGPALDAVARGVIDADGRWPAYQHGLGHGIGLATHEAPSLGRSASAAPLPSPTVFSVEPGIYLEGETGVRIEDLVAVDASAGTLRRLTRFPGGVVVVG